MPKNNFIFPKSLFLNYWLHLISLASLPLAGCHLFTEYKETSAEHLPYREEPLVLENFANHTKIIKSVELRNGGKIYCSEPLVFKVNFVDESLEQFLQFRKIEIEVSTLDYSSSIILTHQVTDKIIEGKNRIYSVPLTYLKNEFPCHSQYFVYFHIDDDHYKVPIEVRW